MQRARLEYRRMNDSAPVERHICTACVLELPVIKPTSAVFELRCLIVGRMFSRE